MWILGTDFNVFQKVINKIQHYKNNLLRKWYIKNKLKKNKTRKFIDKSDEDITSVQIGFYNLGWNYLPYLSAKHVSIKL